MKRILKKIILRFRYVELFFKSKLRQLFEIFGIDILSRPARYNLDKKLEKYLPNKGTFVEAGATDGYTESNTYYLEKFKNWNGVLVEPIPSMYKKCRKERTKSKVFNCALVSDEYQSPTVVMNTGYIMSTIKGSLGGGEKEHLEKAKHFHGVQNSEISVKARTLTSILEESHIGSIDFLSLDVEGYELNVLKGLDFSKFKPRYLLIECLTEENERDLTGFLSKWYEQVEQLTKRDYLFRAKA